MKNKKTNEKNWHGKIFLAIIIFGGVFGLWKLSTLPKTATTPVPKNILEAQSDDWIKGNKEAKVVLIEYSDFQCPACGAYASVITQLHQEFGDKVSFVYRHFPLSFHKNALGAAIAAEAAGKQGKFWEMHDLIFDNQKTWAEKPKTQEDAEDDFRQYAETLGLDVEKFKQDRKDKTLEDRIRRDMDSGNRLKIQGTPTFFLNGEKLQNPRSYEEFKKVIEAAR